MIFENTELMLSMVSCSIVMAIYRFPETEAKLIDPEASPLINRLLTNRGVTEETKAAFVAPDYTALHEPALLHDMDTAVARVVSAFNENEKIAIFSDYDCDGIPGGVILHDCFKALGYTNFINYIPHRHYEGFGVSKEAIDTLIAQGVTLMITIDCGTSDVAAIAYAQDKGIDVIVTDHHEPGEELPAAVAIVNPKLGEYPFTELCGAAVAFKLAQALLEAVDHELVPGYEKWWLDMVGIATIADMVPLIGENRIFAHYGLTVLRKSRRPGLQQLLRKNRVQQHRLTEEDIGFTIGPRVNAASRMDTPEDAFNLLATTDIAEAGAHVTHLEKLNTERKTAVALITRELHQRLKKLESVPDVIVLGSPDWKPSLVGIAANKIAEEHNKPVFLWGTDGNGKYKGSCRSGGGISVVTLMQKASDVFMEHGGHHFSGGFSVKDDQIFTFAEALNEAYAELGEDAAFEEELLVDELLSLNDVSYDLVRELRKLAPFGIGNAKPLFAFKNVTPRKVEQFGKGKEHLKVTYESDNGPLEAISFFSSPATCTKTPRVDTPHTLIAHVEESFFMGRQQLRLMIVDIV
jgi:single-stranded-DNA-specific exonuclease